MEEQGSNRGARVVLVAVVAVVVALLVVFVVTSGGDEGGGETEEAASPVEEVGFDERTGTCVGAAGPALSRCRTELGQAKLALKNAATAEELHATSTGGAYTNQISDLEAQGFSKPPAVVVTIVSAGDTYCIESSSEFLAGSLHYDSTEGTISPGPCPSAE